MAFDASIDILTEELIAAVAKLPPKARTKQSDIRRSVALNRGRLGLQAKGDTETFNAPDTYKSILYADESIRREIPDRRPSGEIQYSELRRVSRRSA